MSSSTENAALAPLPNRERREPQHRVQIGRFKLLKARKGSKKLRKPPPTQQPVEVRGGLIRRPAAGFASGPNFNRARAERCTNFLLRGRLQLRRIHFSDDHCFAYAEDSAASPTLTVSTPAEADASPHHLPLFQPRAGKLRVWGVISLNYKFLTINSDAPCHARDWYLNSCLRPYVEDLAQKKLVPIFQSDSSSLHHGPGVQQLQAEVMLEVLRDWPSLSPDLNPINDIMALLQARVAENSPSKKAPLEERVRQEWDAISMSDINKLVLGFRDRCQRCLDQEGRLPRVENGTD